LTFELVSDFELRISHFLEYLMFSLIYPRKPRPRRSRRRVAQFAPPPPPPPPVGARVAGVLRTDVAACLWVFDEEILDVQGVAGLWTAVGGNGEGFDWIDEFRIIVNYAEDVPVGTAWETMLAEITISFVSGHPLLYGSGLVE
jgi:hypothetical protein